MPRGGARPNTGGARPGAGRPRTRTTIDIELTEQATRELSYFIQSQNLSPKQAGPMVSAIVLAALTKDIDKWADRFGNEPIEQG
jgi:hypothetical protein